MAIEPEAVIAAARGWIGTPYLHQASLKGAGCDCLGMVRGVWRELKGAEPENVPPYSWDWAEARGEEILLQAFRRHMRMISPEAIGPGMVALFRMMRHGPAKHCGVIAGSGRRLTLIHSRQNKCVNEEPFSMPWRRRLAFAFEIQ